MTFYYSLAGCSILVEITCSIPLSSALCCDERSESRIARLFDSVPHPVKTILSSPASASVVLTSDWISRNRERRAFDSTRFGSFPLQ